MKNIAPFALAILFFIPLLAFSQNSGIDVALSQGNAVDLGVFFAQKVDVSILDSEASSSTYEAVTLLKDFFSKNAVKTYKRTHLTSATSGRSSYSLGDLLTSAGTYRVYLFYDSNQKISEIRIEK